MNNPAPRHSGPYRSSLFNFCHRQWHQWRDRLEVSGRKLQMTLNWTLQILLYPVYVAVQAGRRMRGDRVPDRHLTGTPSPPTEPPGENRDRPGFGEPEGNLNPGDLPPIASSPLPVFPFPLSKIQGLAWDLTRGELVLVDRHNDTSPLNPELRGSWQQQWVMGLSAWSYGQNPQTLAPVLWALVRLSDRSPWIPLGQWLDSMAQWMQTQDLALAANLFQEAQALPPATVPPFPWPTLQGFPQKLAQDLAQDLAAKLPQDLAQDLTAKLPQGLAQDLAAKLLQDLATKLPQGLAQDLAAKLPQDLAQDLAAKSPQDIPKSPNFAPHIQDKITLVVINLLATAMDRGAPPGSDPGLGQKLPQGLPQGLAPKLPQGLAQGLPQKLPPSWRSSLDKAPLALAWVPLVEWADGQWCQVEQATDRALNRALEQWETPALPDYQGANLNLETATLGAKIQALLDRHLFGQWLPPLPQPSPPEPWPPVLMPVTAPLWDDDIGDHHNTTEAPQPAQPQPWQLADPLQPGTWDEVWDRGNHGVIWGSSPWAMGMDSNRSEEDPMPPPAPEVPGQPAAPNAGIPEVQPWDDRLAQSPPSHGGSPHSPGDPWPMDPSALPVWVAPDPETRDPEAIDAAFVPVGYVRHPLERLLHWFDGFLATLENWLKGLLPKLRRRSKVSPSKPPSKRPKPKRHLDKL